MVQKEKARPATRPDGLFSTCRNPAEPAPISPDHGPENPPRTQALSPREGFRPEGARPGGAVSAGARLRYAALFAALRSRSPTPAPAGGTPDPAVPSSSTRRTLLPPRQQAPIDGQVERDHPQPDRHLGFPRQAGGVQHGHHVVLHEAAPVPRLAAQPAQLLLQ